MFSNQNNIYLSFLQDQTFLELFETSFFPFEK